MISALHMRLAEHLFKTVPCVFCLVQSRRKLYHSTDHWIVRLMDCRQQESSIYTVKTASSNTYFVKLPTLWKSW